MARPATVRRRSVPNKNRASVRHPARVTRKSRVAISEDEADNIICDRRLNEPTISLEDYLVKRGHALANSDRKIR